MRASILCIMATLASMWSYLDAGSIYWVEKGNLRRANLDGSDFEDLGPFSGRGANIVSIELDVDNNKMFVGDAQGRGRIWRANLDGTNAAVIVDRCGCENISADFESDWIYYGDREIGIKRVSFDGRNSEIVLRRPLSNGTIIDADSNWMYWTEGVRGNELYRAQTDGSDMEFITRIVRSNIHINERDGKVYVGARHVANVDGTDVNQKGGVAGRFVAIDPLTGRAYWTQDGGVYRARLDGTEKELLVIGGTRSERPMAIALDLSDVVLQPGDSDEDWDFDILDLLHVQIAGKYRSGQQASWFEGDWNGAPGGIPGDPPVGDGVFDQRDIIAALASGTYLIGPYQALRPNGQQADNQTSIVYDATTGGLSVDAPAGTKLTSISVESESGIFTAGTAQNLGGSFDIDSDESIFKATFGGSFGSLSFGNVAQPGLSEEFLIGDLTAIGSLAGGGTLGDVDLLYVPEPSTIVLMLVAITAVCSSVRSLRDCHTSVLEHTAPLIP